MKSDIKETAYHEAGHAVVNYLNNFKMIGVWIAKVPYESKELERWHGQSGA